MKKIKNYVDYEELLLKDLQNPQEALGYLNAALLDEDQRVFLLALKDVLTAQNIDISSLADEASITRQNIYRMLSAKGNPRWNSLTSLFKALGLHVHLSPVKKRSKVELFPIDKKLYTLLAKQAAKTGVSLDVLVHEKLQK